MKTRKIRLALCAVALGAAVAASAATLDLGGVGRTVTDVAELAGYDGVTNSSGGDPATLTFSPASDMAYAGTIGGNIRLVKAGNGMLTLSGANTYTGGTEVNHGRLMAGSVSAFGATTGAIDVNSDCQQTSMTSNKVTCVVFGCAGTFAYPINTSAWTTPAEGATGTRGQRQYNVAATVDGVTLSGKITGGGLSVHFGGLEWTENPATAGSGSTLTISGDIDCPNGTCCFSSRATTIKVTGKVTALGIYQNPNCSSWPPVWQLDHADNEIGVIDVSGGMDSDRYLTASKKNALGGATIYAQSSSSAYVTSLTKSCSVRLSADQKVESFMMRPSGNTYEGGPLPDSNTHYVYAKAAATVTIASTANRTCDWLLRDDGASKAMSIVYEPLGDYTYTCVGHTNTIRGTITVRGGTFAIGDSCRFPNVTAVTVASGATLKVETDDALSSSVTLEAESGAALVLDADVFVASLKVGGGYLPSRGYSAGTHGGLSITGSGTLYVASSPGSGTYTWTGGGADDNITTAGNWENSAAPDFDGEAPFVVFAGGAAAVLNRDVTLSGVTFAGAGDFVLSAAGKTLMLGAGGISNAPAASARAVTVSAPVMPLASQTWQMETNTSFTLSGVLKRYGTAAAPTITVRQGSYADPVIRFVGAATAEGASDFAGDVVFEETPLAGGRYGTAYVRASGHEPFGPGGTLKIRSAGTGHYSSARRARLYLSNAVLSKSIELGEYYGNEIYADDNTTNIVGGAITVFKVNTSSGTFPPYLYAGTNAVLRLTGAMDFGTRIGSSAQVSVGSSHADIAEAALLNTGTVAFDGQISRVPAVSLTHPVTLELNAADNAVTNMNLRWSTPDSRNGKAVVRFGVSGALDGGRTEVALPTSSNRALDLDLNGTVQHIAAIARDTDQFSAYNVRLVSSGGPGTLRVSQPFDAQFEGSVATNVTLQMEGGAVLTVTNNNGTAFEAGSTLAISNGTVALSRATEVNREVDLKLLGGKIAVPSGAVAEVGYAWYLDGEGQLKPLGKGTYGPGDAKVGAFFAEGSGSIRVRKGPPRGFIIVVH